MPQTISITQEIKFENEIFTKEPWESPPFKQSNKIRNQSRVITHTKEK